MNIRILCRAVVLSSCLTGLTCLLPLTAAAADLTVSAASSLTNAFRELAPVFEAENPGAKVVFNFAASDALLAQIAKGAPIDVFASADQEAMDRADSLKLLAPGSKHNFVSNTLVVITPIGSALDLKALVDLQKSEVKRVTLGNAAVPFGRYARGALDAARLWSAIEPKAIYGQNVRQSLDYVARGEVDAGFVYLTDVAIQKDKVKLAFSVATETPIRYPIAAVADSPNPAAARKFVAFVLTPPAQAVLARFGFGRP